MLKKTLAEPEAKHDFILIRLENAKKFISDRFHDSVIKGSHTFKKNLKIIPWLNREELRMLIFGIRDHVFNLSLETDNPYEKIGAWFEFFSHAISGESEDVLELFRLSEHQKEFIRWR